jgi:hypothetical protein
MMSCSFTRPLEVVIAALSSDETARAKVILNYSIKEG